MSGKENINNTNGKETGLTVKIVKNIAVSGSRKRCNDFEEIFDLIGSEGKYQKMLLYCVLCPIVALSPFMTLNQIFIWDVPDHWCHVPGRDPSMSLEEWKNLTLPWEKGADGGMRFSQCKMFDRNSTSGSPSSAAVVSCQHGWEYDPTDGITLPSQYHYVCERSHYATEFSTWNSLGSAIGSIIFGVMADKTGRKPIFFLAVVTNVLFRSVSLLLLTQHYPIYKIFQLLGGLSSSTSRVLPELIIAEVCGANFRPWIYTVSEMVWVAGNSLLPLIAMLFREWFVFGLVSVFPGILLVLYYPVIDESPRWLLTIGKTKKAAKILFKIAKKNGKILNETEIQEMVEELSRKQLKEKESDPLRVRSLFSKPWIFKNMFVLMILWTVNNLLYDGVTLNTTKMAGNQFLNYFLVAVIELPGGWLAGKLVEITGRRWTQVGFFLFSAVACLAGGLSAQYFSNYAVFVIMSAVGIKLGVSVTELVLYLQSTEIFPTQLRSTGIGLVSTMASTIGTLGPYIVYSGTVHVSLPYLVLCICTCFAVVAAAFLPETFKQNLPETVEDANHFGRDHKFWSYLPRTQQTAAVDKPESDKQNGSSGTNAVLV